jgi:hypothetical protein
MSVQRWSHDGAVLRRDGAVMSAAIVAVSLTIAVVIVAGALIAAAVLIAGDFGWLRKGPRR